MPVVNVSFYSFTTKTLIVEIHNHTRIYIQGVSRLVDITVGGDFLGLCDQKSSYKHVSDFGRLRSYGYFLIPVPALVWTASYGTSWRVMYSAWWLIVCVASIMRVTWLAQFTTERQPVLRPVVAFRKPALSTDQFKLKVISRSQLYIYTLNVSCIMLVYYFVPFIVNNRYLLF